MTQSLGKRLRISRQALGYSQSDLAARTGFKASAISHFETDRRKPSMGSLSRLAKQLGVTADYLLSGDQKSMKLIDKRTATQVKRSPSRPWEWPRVAQAMASDSFDVLGMQGMGLTAKNGDPLSLAYAVNMLQSLYRCGYGVVDLREKR